VHPQEENYFGNVNSVGLRSCYDEAKRFAEALTMAHHREHGTKTRIARIFNTYGPRMRLDDGRITPAFFTNALYSKSLPVHGEGNQTRSFCYVSDLVEGLYLLMQSEESLPVNLGNPEEFTILELAKKIIKITNSKSKIVFKKLPQDDPVKRKPDIDLAKKRLKWQPKISVSDGLLKTITYFKQSLNKK
jgi:dTDP-glucose 4,6-dehydratase